MAECQGHFREEQKGRELEINKYHIFGPSVFNMHIESWWGWMTTAQTGQWRELFQQYTDAGEFCLKNQWDIMALRYMYMNLIQAHLAHFINVWNAHYIRNQ